MNEENILVGSLAAFVASTLIQISKGVDFIQENNDGQLSINVNRIHFECKVRPHRVVDHERGEVIGETIYMCVDPNDVAQIISFDIDLRQESWRQK